MKIRHLNIGGNRLLGELALGLGHQCPSCWLNMHNYQPFRHFHACITPNAPSGATSPREGSGACGLCQQGAVVEIPLIINPQIAPVSQSRTWSRTSRLSSLSNPRRPHLTKSYLKQNTMSNSRGWPLLEVNVTFPAINPPSDASVSIRFPELDQAKWYHDYITKKSFHSINNLQSRRRDNTVSVRLPSRFTRISESVHYDGFYFTVSDKKLAQDWVENMLVWRLLPESSANPNQAQLGVIRNWSEDPGVSPWLLACLSSPKTGPLPPALPQRPAGYDNPSAIYGGRNPPRELGGAVGSSGPRPRAPPVAQPRDIGQAVGSRCNSIILQ